MKITNNYLSFQNIILSVLLIFFLSLTQFFDWWINFKFSKIDIFIISLSFLLSLFKRYFQITIMLLLSIFLINLGFFAAIASNIFLIFCSYLIGFGLLKFFTSDNGIFSINSLIIGFASLSLSINILSFFKVNYFLIYLFLLLLPTIIILIKYFNLLKINFLNVYNSAKTEYNFNSIQVFFVTSLICYIFFVSIFPERGHDGLSTHLAIPSMTNYLKYYHYDFQNYVWAVQPYGAQWIFTILYVFAGEPAVKLFSPIVCVIFFIYMVRYLDSYLTTNKDTSFYIALLVISLPITFELVRNLHVEIFHSFVIFSIIINLLDKKINWKIISILTGFAFAIKSSTILIVPLLVVLFLADFKKKFSWKEIPINFALILLFGSLPYFVALIKTGSPTFPLYNEIFQSDYISKTAFYHPLYGKQSLTDLFFTTFNSIKYGAFTSNGAISIFFPLFLIPIIFWFKKIAKNKLLLVFIFLFMSIVIMFIFQSLLRYIYFLLPSLIIVMMLINRSIIQNHKLLNILLIFCIFLGILKYDKTLYPLPDKFNLYIDRNELIKYDESQQPLKYFGKKINNIKKYKDKKIFILTNIDQPQYAIFEMKVAFWSWHSLKFYLELISSGNLEKTLNKLEYDYLVIEKNYNKELKSHIFSDDPKKVGVFYEEIDNFLVHKIR